MRCNQLHDVRWADYTEEALRAWNLQDAHVTKLSLSENATYLIQDATGVRGVLRMHRPGYRTRAEIESELAWLDAIEETGRIHIARAMPTCDGSKLGVFKNPLGDKQYAVLFNYLRGTTPHDADFTDNLERIGSVAAILHTMSRTWMPPQGFTRATYDCNHMFGSTCDYGDWRLTTGIDSTQREVFERVERKIRHELASAASRNAGFGLIHSDIRSDNLVIADDGTVQLLDFDDCAFGWYMFDLACTFTFDAARDDLEQQIKTYLAGYMNAGGSLNASDFALVPTCFMARQLQMLAWIEFRNETDYAQRMHDTMIKEAESIAYRYLQDEYLMGIARMQGSAPVPFDEDNKAHVDRLHVDRTPIDRAS